MSRDDFITGARSALDAAQAICLAARHKNSGSDHRWKVAHELADQIRALDPATIAEGVDCLNDPTKAQLETDNIRLREEREGWQEALAGMEERNAVLQARVNELEGKK